MVLSNLSVELLDYSVLYIVMYKNPIHTRMQISCKPVVWWPLLRPSDLRVSLIRYLMLMLLYFQSDKYIRFVSDKYIRFVSDKYKSFVSDKDMTVGSQHFTTFPRSSPNTLTMSFI